MSRWFFFPAWVQCWLERRLPRHRPWPQPEPPRHEPWQESQEDPEATLFSVAGLSARVNAASQPPPEVLPMAPPMEEILELGPQYVPPPAMDGMQGMLADINGISGRPVIPLEGSILPIGRLPDPDFPMTGQIIIPEKAISRKHARIHLRHDGHWIEDMGSLNGTCLNGQRLTRPTRLTHGDRIRLDVYEFEYRLNPSKEEDILDLI